MHEEDRIRALELYNNIFDETGNETALLQLLISPTRQAVALARAYDDKESSSGRPSYLQVIEQLRSQAMALAPVVPKPDTDQFSLFEQPSSEEPVFPDFEFDMTEDADDAAPPLQEPFEIGFFPDEDRGGVSAPLSTPPAMAQEQAKPSDPVQELDDFTDAVEAFLADFTISDEAMTADFSVPNRAPAPPQDEESAWGALQAPTEKAAAPANVLPKAEVTVSVQPTPAEPAKEPSAPAEPRRVSVADLPDLPVQKERKPVVPLLILFILFAIPLGLLCLGVIVAAGLLFLSLGAVLLFGAVIGFGSAFTVFSVFADILLVFGLSLAAAAFSLLFFWFFVWLLIGAIPGLIRGICALARELCYKEVAA